MERSSPFRLTRKTPFGIGENIAEWATGLSKLNRFYSQRPAGCDSRDFLRFTLNVLGIDYNIIHGCLGKVPAQGPTVVVANHPLGCVEGIILAEMLLMIRNDVQILANQYLKTVPELDSLFIGVDVFATDSAHQANMKALRLANKHLQQGGLLLMFPAGEVSQLVDKKTRKLEDKEWSRSVSSLIRKHQAQTVPVFIHGHNSRRFYMAGKIHPLLRTLLLGRELLNKKADPVDIAIGGVIPFKELNTLSDQQVVNYLRLNTYLLQKYTKHPKADLPANNHLQLPIDAALPLSDLLDDINTLPEQQHLLSSGNFDVYCSTAEYIPSILHEIGRVREENFRRVGEGTGLTLDIDQFDRTYLHLFIWDKSRQCLVGAYRLGLTEQLVSTEGMRGLYSRTLFNYDENFLNTMGKSIEMGRSVIAHQYQKNVAPLLLLWQGIATYIQRNPDYTHLFGPVSISNDYSAEARNLMAQTMALHYYDAQSAEYVRPSNPIPEKNARWNTSMLTALGDIQLLSRVIARIDEGKSVPVLLRQYLGMNGKLVCFNVDPGFNNSLDGLMVVDLRQVPARTLGRYMGQKPAEEYLSYHQK